MGVCMVVITMVFVLGETASENATSHFHKRMKGQSAHNYFYSKPSPLEQRNID